MKYLILFRVLGTLFFALYTLFKAAFGVQRAVVSVL